MHQQPRTPPSRPLRVAAGALRPTRARRDLDLDTATKVAQLNRRGRALRAREGTEHQAEAAELAEFYRAASPLIADLVWAATNYNDGGLPEVRALADRCQWAESLVRVRAENAWEARNLLTGTT